MEFEKLANLIEVKSGKWIDKKRDLNRRDEWFKNAFPIWDGGISIAGYYDKFNTDANTITISRSGNCGFINFVTEPFWAGDSCLRVFNRSSKLAYKFIYYFLKWHESELMNAKRGGALSHISGDDIKKIIIPLPPLNHQQKIVSFLDLLQKQIALRERERERVTRKTV